MVLSWVRKPSLRSASERILGALLVFGEIFQTGQCYKAWKTSCSARGWVRSCVWNGKLGYIF